jgi:hypothetical protein
VGTSTYEGKMGRDQDIEFVHEVEFRSLLAVVTKSWAHESLDVGSIVELATGAESVPETLSYCWIYRADQGLDHKSNETSLVFQATKKSR